MLYNSDFLKKLHEEIDKHNDEFREGMRKTNESVQSHEGNQMEQHEDTSERDTSPVGETGA